MMHSLNKRPKATTPRNDVTPGGTIRIHYKDGANIRVGNCWHIIQWTLFWLWYYHTWKYVNIRNKCIFAQPLTVCVVLKAQLIGYFRNAGETYHC